MVTAFRAWARLGLSRASSPSLHITNFIIIHDPAEDIILTDDDNDNPPVDHDHEASAAAAAEIDTPSEKRDNIAQAMWDDYLEVCRQRGIGDEDSSDESMAEDDV